MIMWGRVLIVDDSAVYGQLMRTLMAPHCDDAITATGVRDAIEHLDRHDDFDFVLCDYMMDDGTGLEVLDHIASQPEPRPQVIMVSGYPSEEVAEQARRLGAVDYLAKPTSVRRIVRSLRPVEAGERRQVNPRWRCAGRAHLLDRGGDSVLWDVYDISPQGAFLQTQGPIEIGCELDLRLQLYARKADVRARVVRIQEPSWMNVGGVGVEFVDLDDEAEDVIRAAIEFSVPDSA